MKNTWPTRRGGLLAVLVAGAVIFAGWRTLEAQNTGPGGAGRVACVDVMKVINEYQRQKDLIEEVNEYMERVQAEDSQRKQKIDTLQAEIDRLDRQDPTLVTRMREMLKMQVDFKNWREMTQLEMAREAGLWSIRVYQEVTRATEEVAKRTGYDLVLYRGQFETVSMDPEVIKDQIRSLQVLYANPAVDLTQQVLDKLNTEYRAQPKQPMLMVPAQH